MKTKRSFLIILLVFAVIGGVTYYVSKKPDGPPITLAYQPVINPTQVAQASGKYEKATGQVINWRRFESGGEVVEALVSGYAPMGYAGSVPLAVAISKGAELEAFMITSVTGQAEALIARNGAHINKPEDLVGKKIAVPFSSSSHFSLLTALKHWGVDASKTQIIDMRTSEIANAWQHGEIDASYIWDPTLGKLKATGKVMVSTAEVGKWGTPTYGLWIVRKDFARANPDFVTQFVKVTMAELDQYNADPKAYGSDQNNIEKIVKITGAKPADIPGQLAGKSYPPLKEQIELLQQPMARALATTSEFLKSQGKVEILLPDFSLYVSNQFMQKAGQ